MSEYWENLCQQILDQLNTYERCTDLDQPYPHRLSVLMYLPNIYRSYIPERSSSCFYENASESKHKIRIARTREYNQIRYLLDMYRTNPDPNKSFPLELAYRIYNIPNAMFYEAQMYDSNYNYEKEHPELGTKLFLSQPTYGYNAATFVDMECTEPYLLPEKTRNFNLMDIDFVAPREYVIQKCSENDHIYAQKVHMDEMDAIYEDTDYDTELMIMLECEF